MTFINANAIAAVAETAVSCFANPSLPVKKRALSRCTMNSLGGFINVSSHSLLEAVPVQLCVLGSSMQLQSVLVTPKQKLQDPGAGCEVGQSPEE